jgi:hypothetical protein
VRDGALAPDIAGYAAVHPGETTEAVAVAGDQAVGAVGRLWKRPEKGRKRSRAGEKP